jgi:hypothetical protein
LVEASRFLSRIVSPSYPTLTHPMHLIHLIRLIVKFFDLTLRLRRSEKR